MTASGFFDALASEVLTEGRPRAVFIAGQRLALVRVDGLVYALEEACPHRDGLMSEGDLKGHELSCPLHAWCFDVRDGTARFPPGARLRTFPVREEGGRIGVGLGPWTEGRD
jgi:nitrite reductase/ring-hydroxylating ferredoxin subunit